MQIVRVVIAGGILRSVEPILQATSMAKQRQQAAALAPIKWVPVLIACMLVVMCCEPGCFV